MRALVVSIGSMGDTLPFVAVAKELLARGHDVTVIATGHFRQMVEKEGLSFVDSLAAEQYAAFLDAQKVVSHTRALKLMGEMVLEQIGNVYQLIEERYLPGQTVVASQGYAFGARIAQEKLGVPLATVHLQPMWFRSIHDPPGKPFWWPDSWSRGVDRLIDWVVDRGMAKTTNEFRGELGLPPASRLMKYWWNSPQRVIGLFPDWFNAPQADWPPNVRLVGFPIRPGAPGPLDPPEVEEFLAAGEPPIVFTQSSVTTEAARFFRVSVRAAVELGRRAILLTPHKEQIPADLPSGVRYFPYVPLERLLPRSAALVHHGGIGTIAHCLAAGTPQVTVPMIYDQPDNSQRLERLGVSALIWPRKYKPRRLVKKLAALLESGDVRRRCREYAEWSRRSDGLENACIALEELEGTDRAPSEPTRLAASPAEPG